MSTMLSRKQASGRIWRDRCRRLRTSPRRGPITVEEMIRIHDLEAALQRAGAKDAQVPPEWDGVQLRTEIGPMVTPSYGEDIQIMQARPAEMSIPAGFPLERFAELAFRSLGVSVWQSRALAQRFAADPSLLLDI